MTLTWNNPSNASIIRYEYQTRQSNAWGAWTAIPDSDASTTAYTLTGLNGGTEYRIRLRAVNRGRFRHQCAHRVALVRGSHPGELNQFGPRS